MSEDETSGREGEHPLEKVDLGPDGLTRLEPDNAERGKGAPPGNRPPGQVHPEPRR
jgi:hypothetical protein